MTREPSLPDKIETFRLEDTRVIYCGDNLEQLKTTHDQIFGEYNFQSP